MHNQQAQESLRGNVRAATHGQINYDDGRQLQYAVGVSYRNIILMRCLLNQLQLGFEGRWNDFPRSNAESMLSRR